MRGNIRVHTSFRQQRGKQSYSKKPRFYKVPVQPRSSLPFTKLEALRRREELVELQVPRNSPEMEVIEVTGPANKRSRGIRCSSRSKEPQAVTMHSQLQPPKHTTTWSSKPRSLTLPAMSTLLSCMLLALVVTPLAVVVAVCWHRL